MVGNKSNPVLADCKWLDVCNKGSVFTGHSERARGPKVAAYANRTVGAESSRVQLSAYEDVFGRLK